MTKLWFQRCSISLIPIEACILRKYLSTFLYSYIVILRYFSFISLLQSYIWNHLFFHWIMPTNAEILLFMCPAHERRYNVTSCPIGWAHTQNDPYQWPNIIRWRNSYMNYDDKVRVLYMDRTSSWVTKTYGNQIKSIDSSFLNMSFLFFSMDRSLRDLLDVLPFPCGQYIGGSYRHPTHGFSRCVARHHRHACQLVCQTDWSHVFYVWNPAGTRLFHHL